MQYDIITDLSECITTSAVSFQAQILHKCKEAREWQCTSMENFFLFNLKARSKVTGWWGSRVFTAGSFRRCTRPVNGAREVTPPVKAVMRQEWLQSRSIHSFYNNKEPSTKN